MSENRKRIFQLLFITLIVVNGAEWLAALLEGNIGLIPLRVAAKFVELSLTPIVILLAAWIVGNHKFFYGILGISIGNIGLQIVSLFTGVVFSVDAASVYHRNELYAVYVSLYFFASVLLILHIGGFIQTYQVSNRPLLITLFVMEIMAIAMQMMFSYLRLDWTFISFAVTLFYLYISQLLQQVDTVTKLLNRRVYRAHFEKLPQNSVVIMLDINNFKEINDCYGHAMGDVCLQRSAAILREIFGKTGYCYRYGGDEFVVLMQRNMENADSLLGQLNEKMASEMLMDGVRMPSFSYGCARVEPNKKMEEIMEEADQRMYLHKQEMHRQRAASRRGTASV